MTVHPAFRHPLAMIAVAITEKRTVVYLDRWKRDRQEAELRASIMEARAEIAELQKMIGREAG